MSEDLDQDKMLSRWLTKPLCSRCWAMTRPDREPVRVKDAPEQICIWCSGETTSGIYVRVKVELPTYLPGRSSALYPHP